MMEQETQRYEMVTVTVGGEPWQEMHKESEGDWMYYDDHIAALAAKDAAIAAYKGAVKADVQEFTRDSATLEAQAEQIRVLQSVLSLASDALEEAEAILGGEYGDFHAHLCENMIELKDRIAALASTAPVAEKKEGEQ